MFTNRNIVEIMASQRAMLERTGQQGANIGDEKLVHLSERDLEEINRWIKNQEDLSMITIAYKDMVQEPLPQCRRVDYFLGNCLDVDRMASTLDASLYRNRR